MTADDETRPEVEHHDGSLRVRCAFPAEQEHNIVLRSAVPDDSGRSTILGVARIYSLEPDLFALRPYKGDLHMHSNRSDGKDEPPHVAAACRRIGLDFMALTDHGKYQPSLEAMAAYDGLDLDLAMYPGEEVHPPGVFVHMINFGGSFSVNELFGKAPDAFRTEVASIQQELATDLNERDEFQYAAAVWTYRKITEGGGLSLFCHPYWIYQFRDNVPGPLIDQHLRDLPFDAYELIGGYHPDEMESNVKQVARYHEETRKGREIPIVGVSDAHGCETGALFGWYYTIIFAESCSLDDIAGAIRALRSVAVEAVPGATPRAHGPYRLVAYAQYLMREFFPGHDALCRREGELMLAHSRRDAHAADELAALKGQTTDYMNSCFAS